MAHTKGMGIGAMLVLLALAVIVLPMIVKFIARMEPRFVSGFQDMVSNVPAAASMDPLDTWRPDPNTDYLCRSPNGSGQPCPEGTFCDGTTQSCIKIYPGGATPSIGYFS
jgi:hypothetical protein